MKKLIIIIIILNSTLLFSQKNIISTSQKSEMTKILGNDWIINTSKNEISFRTVKQVYFYNCVSLPVMNKIEMEKYIKQSGRKDNYEIRYLFVKQWSENKINQAISFNDKINKQIDLLPKKYNLSHLTRTKENSFFSDNEEEKKRITQYEEEYKKLSSSIVKLPDFHTINYSIFIRDNINGFECVYLNGIKPFEKDKILKILGI